MSTLQPALELGDTCGAEGHYKRIHEHLEQNVQMLGFDIWGQVGHHKDTLLEGLKREVIVNMRVKG